MSDIFQSNSSSAFLLSNSITLSANNTTANVPVFRITGTVEFLKLYGIVTTAIGSNHTGGFFRMNDQSAQANITLNTVGVTLSSFVAGSTISKSALAATLATVKNSSTGQFYESATAETQYFSPFIITKKSGANTDIEYTYTTTNTPTTGVIQFFVEYRPLSADGAVAAI